MAQVLVRTSTGVSVYQMQQMMVSAWAATMRCQPLLICLDFITLCSGFNLSSSALAAGMKSGGCNISHAGLHQITVLQLACCHIGSGANGAQGMFAFTRMSLLRSSASALPTGRSEVNAASVMLNCIRLLCSPLLADRLPAEQMVLGACRLSIEC